MNKNIKPESSIHLMDKLIGLIEAIPHSDRLLVRIAFFLFIGTTVWLILSINQNHSEITPTSGGSFIEGVVGTPRFVNPALAFTRADQDITALIYSGLLKIGEDGVLKNDLAENISISEDGRTYIVTLRKDVTFHDGTPLTARDVAFTIHLIQDPDLKSPLRGNWSDVTVEEVSEYELHIKLEEVYTPFIENFTLGIMPAHAWSNLPIEQLPFSQLNTEPIGSGPFSVTAARRSTSGVIEHYTLTAFHDNGTTPKIDTVGLAFYQNEEQLLTALGEHKIDATAYVSSEHISQVAALGYQTVEQSLPRVFAIFFNQNRSAALRDTAVRNALTAAINRDVLIENALQGHGVPISTPTILGSSTLESTGSIANEATSSENERAVAILKAGNWTKNDLGLWEKKIDKELVALTVTLKTSNSPFFANLVDSITKQWEAIGVQVTVEQFEQTGLVQSVIRPRDFEALLFGLDMSRSHDLYPFWHSSQQDDPGLNIAQYANVEVDKLLEKARTEPYGVGRIELLHSASDIIVKEQPAIFLFQPTFTYVIAEDMFIAEMKELGRPTDRFSNIALWYTENDSLWTIFRKNNSEE